MTLKDILKDRERQIEFEEEQELIEHTEHSEKIEKLEEEQKADAEELTRLIKNMMRYEKEAVVKGIPTDILQNEITRRMNRDHKALKDVKKILIALDEY